MGQRGTGPSELAEGIAQRRPAIPHSPILISFIRFLHFPPLESSPNPQSLMPVPRAWRRSPHLVLADRGTSGTKQLSEAVPSTSQCPLPSSSLSASGQKQKELVETGSRLVASTQPFPGHGLAWACMGLHGLAWAWPVCKRGECADNL